MQLLANYEVINIPLNSVDLYNLRKLLTNGVLPC